MGDPPDTWPAFARSADRRAITGSALPSLASPAWVRSTDENGVAIDFQYQAAPIVSEQSVFAVGSVMIAGQGTVWKLFAFDRADGRVRWAAEVPSPVRPPLSEAGWSSPVYDAAHDAIIYPSSTFVTALDETDGHPLWQTPLSRIIVNASPLITQDRGPADRLFITDYSPGSGGNLYCINIDPREPGLNPYDPGELVWSVSIGGSVGATPAYLPADKGGVGLVYVCTTNDPAFGPGQVLAFDAGATAPPPPIFATPNPNPFAGFYAGLCVVPNPGGPPSLFAASYSFYGWIDSSNLLKLNAVTGDIVWSAPCNRTSTIPVVFDDGTIAVSGGLWNYGIAPSVDLFHDDGPSATHLWNSALATWDDANGNGSFNAGEFLALGGWTIQPVGAGAPAAPRLIVGAIPPGDSSRAPATDLFIVDTSRAPTDPGFILDHTTLAGGSAAVIDNHIFSLGTAGLIAFGMPPPQFDVNGDGRESVDDLYTWDQGLGDRDCDRDGAVTPADRLALIAHLRANEAASLTYEH